MFITLKEKAMSDFDVGERVIWHYGRSRDYPGVPISAVVTKVTLTNLRLRVQRHDGTITQVYVNPRHVERPAHGDADR
jgi:hypothetical protein